MKCKHVRQRASTWWEPTGYPQMGTWQSFCREVDGEPDRITCDDCHATLSLGDSNDADERVGVEIDAARRAAFDAETNYTPGYDRFDWCPDGGDELCRLCEALYLSSCIHDHSAETSGGGGS